MHEALFVHCGQTGSDLRRDFQRQLYLKPAGAFDEILEGFPLYKLHRVKVILAGSPKVEDRGNILMAHLCCCAGFAQKTKPRCLVTEISLADDFQCHGAAQIYIERFVSDPHRTATQLDGFPVFARHQLIVLKSLHRFLRRRLDRILGSRRRAGLNPASKTLAKHAYWAGFVDPRERCAAYGTGLRLIDVLGHSRPSRLASAKLASVARLAGYASVSN